MKEAYTGIKMCRTKTQQEETRSHSRITGKSGHFQSPHGSCCISVIKKLGGIGVDRFLGTELMTLGLKI